MNIFGKRLFVILLLLTLSFSGFAFEGIKVLKVSSTGNTVILDRGRLEGIRHGAKGRLVYQSGFESPKMIFVAQAEAIKVLDSYSFWHLTRIDNSQLISEGQKLLYVEMEDMLQGRKVSMRKKRIVLPQGKTVVQYLRDDQVGIPDELIYKGQDYEQSEPIIYTEVPKDEHLEVRSFEDWKTQYGLTYIDEYMQDVENRFVSGREFPVEDEEIAQRHDKDVFQTMISGTARKINDLKYGLKGLYRDQKRDEDIRIITEKVQVENAYERDHRERRERKKIEPYAVEKVRREGPRWSSDMDSEELRRFFIQSGIAREKRRQELALDSKEGNEILLRISSGLVNHTDPTDVNFQGTGYSLGIAYEFHLSRTTSTLDRFSVELGLERSIRYFDIGGLNSRFYEGSFYGGLNFYLFNKPYHLNKYLFYLGMGFRRGSATAQASTLTKEYTYQFISVPSFQTGIKYRFFAGDERDNTLRIGLGYNIMVSYELLRYSVNETLVDDIDGLFAADDMRLYAGLSLYF